MRILVVNWQDRLNPQAGGAETHLHEVFGRIATRHDVTLLVSGWRGAPPRARVDGLDVHRAGGRFTFSLAAPRYYRRALQRENFDVMVEDLNKVPLYSPLWARHRPALVVHHLFGRTAFGEASVPVAAATWLLERPIGRVYRDVPTIAVSESTAGDLARRGLRRTRIRVVPNGVDLEFFQPAPGPRDPRPTLLYLGRLKRYKRVDLVLRAVARLRHEGVDARLVVAGTGDHESALRALAERLGLGAAVEFRGFVDEQEKRRLFRSAWLHTLTSEKEGWGITNMEAAACGTATVASDAPGLRDSVLDGRTGLLVPHGDVAALATAYGRVLADPRLRDELGREARRFAERFSWERSAAETLEFLERVARGWTGDAQHV